MQALRSIDGRIDRYHAELVGFLSRRCPGEGEELAQETWLRVARSSACFEDDRSFRAFAFTVARRLLIDHHRRRKARVTLVPLEGGPDPRDAADPHGALVAGETLAVVEAALATMKPELAEVFRLRMGSEISFKEIAAGQGVPLNTALGRMHAATKHIRAALLEAGLIRDDP